MKGKGDILHQKQKCGGNEKINKFVWGRGRGRGTSEGKETGRGMGVMAKSQVY